jgi:LCP family protein required for cell wall assembly
VDDDFGPALRGGSGRGRTAAPVPPTAPAEPVPGDDGFGPSQPGRRRIRLPRFGGRGGPGRHTALRVLAVALVAVVLFAVALTVLATVRMNRVEVAGLAAGNGPMNVLVVGSDSREGLTRRQRRELGTGHFEGARTDTILLLQVNGGQAAMLSFPRDLVVQRCDGTTGRINVAYATGGPSCLAETITETSGIPVTHYLEVSFLGFHDIVNAVGGVEICLKRPISDVDAHIDLPAGCQVLDGKQALGYVRVRKIDNDLGRIGRQQQFLKELAAEVAKPSTVLNPVRLVATTNAVAGALTVDRGFGPLDLLRLGAAARDIAGGDYPALAVPAVPGFLGGASVLTPTAEADAVYAEFRDGTAVQRGGAALKPSDVTVAVRNGTDRAGLAGQAAEALRAAGFVVSDVGNAEPAQRTVVRFRQGNEDAARLLAKRLPGDVPVEPAQSGPPVVLLLGADAQLN